MRIRNRIPFRRISVGEADGVMKRDDVLLLDVRDPAAFAKGHIEGAENVSIRNLSGYIEGSARARPVLIYCYHGYASQEFAKVFSDFGFSEVYSMDGGYEAWETWTRRPQAGVRAALDPSLQQWLAGQGFPSDDVNGTVGNKMTPLMRAGHKGDVAVIRQLIAAGAVLDARNGDGNNALWLACVDNQLEAIDALVDAGVDIDNRNDNGATALMYAASSGKADVVMALLARGADTALETQDGFTALDMAASIECLTLLRNASRAGARKAAAGAR